MILYLSVCRTHPRIDFDTVTLLDSIYEKKTVKQSFIYVGKREKQSCSSILEQLF